MKRALLILVLWTLSSTSVAQTTLFHDSFEVSCPHIAQFFDDWGQYEDEYSDICSCIGEYIIANEIKQNDTLYADFITGIVQPVPAYDIHEDVNAEEFFDHMANINDSCVIE